MRCLRCADLILVCFSVSASPAALTSLLSEHRVTRLVLVPMLLRALLDTAWERQASPTADRSAGGFAGSARESKTQPQLSHLPLLRVMVSSGEPLRAELAARFRRLFPGQCAFFFDAKHDPDRALCASCRRQTPRF
jgi:acyl-CoA synthetase (AMP-forming)/AMP-acid ligase II